MKKLFIPIAFVTIFAACKNNDKNLESEVVTTPITLNPAASASADTAVVVPPAPAPAPVAVAPAPVTKVVYVTRTERPTTKV